MFLRQAIMTCSCNLVIKVFFILQKKLITSLSIIINESWLKIEIIQMINERVIFEQQEVEQSLNFEDKETTNLSLL